jgi:hypothetical protein
MGGVNYNKEFLNKKFLILKDVLNEEENTMKNSKR